MLRFGIFTQRKNVRLLSKSIEKSPSRTRGIFFNLFDGNIACVHYSTAAPFSPFFPQSFLNQKNPPRVRGGFSLTSLTETVATSARGFLSRPTVPNLDFIERACHSIAVKRAFAYAARYSAVNRTFHILPPSCYYSPFVRKLSKHIDKRARIL